MNKSLSIPEELIKIKAQEFWKKRQREGRDGTPEDSRIEARQYLEKHRWEVFQWKLTQRLSKRPIKRFADWWETTPIEKFVLEDIKYLLEESAFVSIVTLIAEITIILSLITWITGRKERWENEIFSTWQVVNNAPEDQSGVVKLALERLLSNDFSLAGLKLQNTYLYGANLQKAELRRANLQKADLRTANLQKAGISGVNLKQAYLIETNLQQAYLIETNLQQADLSGANLQQANLRRAKLQQAYLIETNLQQADLSGANLHKADLSGANLYKAALYVVGNLTPKQIKSTCFWEKALYEGEWNDEKKTYVVTEPDNTNFIEELKKDKSSDPTKKPDCSFWKR